LWSEKLAYFVRDGEQFVGHEDVLLYNLTGEYLWIAVEVEEGIRRSETEDAGVSRLSDMRLDTQGDNFLWTFPEIYQEEGGFFHRYLSIFSSIYQDMSEQIANLDRLLDIDETPVPFLLELAEWLGFSAEGDFPDEEMLRRLVKELYGLNRIKGTKEVIRRLTGIVLGAKTCRQLLIIERNRLEGHIPDNVRATYQRLYGSGMHDVTILVKHGADERLHSQLMYLIRQFKPARSHIRLVFSQQCSSLDSYCYLDFNAALSRKGHARTDRGSRMDGTVFMRSPMQGKAD
jgi:phage tail-like protein